MPDWFLSVAEGSADRLHEPKTLLTSLPIINTGQRRAFFLYDETNNWKCPSGSIVLKS
jgi:hypothetical protein